MCSTAAVPVWKAGGMSYITYSAICANLIRKCRKDSVRPESLKGVQAHSPVDGESEKPGFFKDNIPDELKMYFKDMK